jgi:hypothetical protein
MLDVAISGAKYDCDVRSGDHNVKVDPEVGSIARSDDMFSSQLC